MYANVTLKTKYIIMLHSSVFKFVEIIQETNKSCKYVHESVIDQTIVIILEVHVSYYKVCIPP